MKYFHENLATDYNGTVELEREISRSLKSNRRITEAEEAERDEAQEKLLAQINDSSGENINDL
jgi:hypothetical protein